MRRIVGTIAEEANSEDEISVVSLRVLIDRALINVRHSFRFAGLLLVNRTDVKSRERSEDLLRVTVIESVFTPLATFEVEAVHIDTFRRWLVGVLLLHSSRVHDIIE